LFWGRVGNEVRHRLLMLQITRFSFLNGWSNVWRSPVERHFNRKECTQLIHSLFFCSW
jgi:hypothetical protein